MSNDHVRVICLAPYDRLVDEVLFYIFGIKGEKQKLMKCSPWLVVYFFFKKRGTCKDNAERPNKYMKSYLLTKLVKNSLQLSLPMPMPHVLGLIDAHPNLQT